MNTFDGRRKNTAIRRAAAQKKNGAAAPNPAFFFYEKKKQKNGIGKCCGPSFLMCEDRVFRVRCAEPRPADKLKAKPLRGAGQKKAHFWRKQDERFPPAFFSPSALTSPLRVVKEAYEKKKKSIPFSHFKKRARTAHPDPLLFSRKKGIIF
jgi:hypothetical protein